MIVYHGSKIKVSNPDIYHSRKKVDFGTGFYSTPLYEQAKSLCQRYLRTTGKAFISKYILDDKAFKVCKVLKFESHSEEWLDFILSCRREKDNTDYDIVMGGVANDNVFDTVELYFENLIDKKEAIKRL